MPIAPPRHPGLRAGQLRSLVKIQARTDVRDASGGFQPVWSDVPGGTVWASIVPMVVGRGGGEFVTAEVLHTPTVYRITMRYRTDITERHRLLEINRETGTEDLPYNIISVDDPDRRRRRLVIICESGLTNG